MFRRRILVVLLCGVLGGVAAYLGTVAAHKKYAATAALLFNYDQINNQVAGLGLSVNTDIQAEQDTNLQLVQVRDLAARTASAVGQGLTADVVRGMLSFADQGDTTIVNISAMASDPALAAQVANTYAATFVAAQQQQTSGLYDSALATVKGQLAALTPAERRGAQGAALQERAASLETIKGLKPAVSVAETASVPSQASSPKVGRDLALGVTLGLIIGVLIAVLMERLDQRIREPGDLEDISALPLLGIVPASKYLEGAPTTPGRTMPTRESDAFQQIRARLRYFNVDRAVRVVMVASATPGEGKTTVAYSLALAAARAGAHALVIDADLRIPTVARTAGVTPSYGLSDVLVGHTTLEEAVVQVDIPEGPDDEIGRRTVSLLAEAAVPPNPVELIESPAMAEVIDRARIEYDLIVIDTPPLASVSDAVVLLDKVDGVLFVGRVGNSRKDLVERVLRVLRLADAPLLGVVANGVAASSIVEPVYQASAAAHGRSPALSQRRAISGRSGERDN